MKRMLMVVAMLAVAGSARADGKISLDPRVALAVERDNLMPVVVQPRVDVIAVDRPAPAGYDRLWKVVDTSMLIASTAALAIDWRQTRSAAVEHWAGGINGEGRHEANPIMGLTPSTRTVDIYFAGTIAVNAAFWIVLPPRWRSVIPGIVIGAEAPTIAGNLLTTHL